MRLLKVAALLVCVYLLVQLVRFVVHVVTLVRAWFAHLVDTVAHGVTTAWVAAQPFILPVLLTAALVYVLGRLAVAVVSRWRASRRYSQWHSGLTRQVVRAVADGSFVVRHPIRPPYAAAPPGVLGLVRRRERRATTGGQWDDTGERGQDRPFVQPADPHERPPAAAAGPQPASRSLWPAPWVLDDYAVPWVPAPPPTKVAHAAPPRPTRTRAELKGLGTEQLVERISELVPPKIRVSGKVRGLQIGSGNTQDNLYVWRLRTPPIDLAKRLDEPDVRAAVDRLAANPRDRAARQDLVRQVSPGGWPLGDDSHELRVAVLGPGKRSSKSSLLGTTLLQGAQIGDGVSQHNTFTHTVTPKVDARKLLKSNRELAKSLVDCAFPTCENADSGTLDRALRNALEQAEVDPKDGIARAVRAEMPDPGKVLHIRNSDGVCIGSNNTMNVGQKVKPGSVRARPVPIRTRPWSDLYPTGSASPASPPRPHYRSPTPDVHIPGPGRDRDGRGGGISRF